MAKKEKYQPRIHRKRIGNFAEKKMSLYIIHVADKSNMHEINKGTDLIWQNDT